MRVVEGVEIRVDSDGTSHVVETLDFQCESPEEATKLEAALKSTLASRLAFIGKSTAP